MASTINGTSTGSGGLISTGDDSGILNIQTNETTAITIDASQAVTIQGLTVGKGAGAVATNTAVGASALVAVTTGANNSAGGYFAGKAIVDGALNTAFGSNALLALTNNNANSAFGANAGKSITTSGNNTMIGSSAGFSTSTGANNVSVGAEALYANTTASGNTAVGYQAGYSNTTGTYGTYVGYGAGLSITTGSKNTIIGAYTGNNGGLDIRTTSNNIVLSDGDGNPRAYWSDSGNITVPATYNNTTATAANMVVGASGFYARSTSALKYKQDVRDLEEIDISTLRPVRYKSKCEGDDQTKDHFGLIADEAADAGFEELVTRGATGEVEGFQYERLTVVLLKAIQEQQAIIESLTQRITALEGA